MSQAMKLCERIVEKRFCVLVEINLVFMVGGYTMKLRVPVEINLVFMVGGYTMKPIFALRQVTEKYRASQKDLYAAFIDLEKSFDRVPRKAV